MSKRGFVHFDFNTETQQQSANVVIIMRRVFIDVPTSVNNQCENFVLLTFFLSVGNKQVGKVDEDYANAKGWQLDHRNMKINMARTTAGFHKAICIV